MRLNYCVTIIRVDNLTKKCRWTERVLDSYNITMDMYMNEFNSNERIKTYSCTHFHCKLRCLDIENGVIHFTTALNEILVIKNIKEFYVNDICVDMDVNTI